MTGGAADRVDDVSLRVPAEPGYVSMIRTLAAGLAARLDFTMDDIEDLRMAVSEACATVLDEADPDTEMQCGFAFSDTPGRLTVTLTVTTSSVPDPQYDSFAWQVLTTLAEDVTQATGPDSFTLSLRVGSAVLAAGAAVPSTESHDRRGV